MCCLNHYSTNMLQFRKPLIVRVLTNCHLVADQVVKTKSHIERIPLFVSRVLAIFSFLSRVVTSSSFRINKKNNNWTENTTDTQGNLNCNSCVRNHLLDINQRRQQYPVMTSWCPVSVGKHPWDVQDKFSVSRCGHRGGLGNLGRQCSY